VPTTGSSHQIRRRGVTAPTVRRHETVDRHRVEDVGHAARPVD
jgi:hypothetical protein